MVKKTKTLKLGLKLTENGTLEECCSESTAPGEGCKGSGLPICNELEHFVLKLAPVYSQLKTKKAGSTASTLSGVKLISAKKQRGKRRS